MYFILHWRFSPLCCPTHLRSPLFTAFLALTLIVAATAAPAAGQTRAAARKPSAKSTQKPNASASPALAELQKRVAALQTARDSGDSQAVTQGSRALIALGLRQVAHLRLVEDAFAPAIELYKRSLDFEDNPATRIDLAIAYLRGKKLDDALSEVRTAILKDPDDARAWHVQGSIYTAQAQYAPASDSLQRSVAIRDDLEADYSLAICYLAIHDKEKAAAVFKKMDEHAADRGALRVLMARAYRDGGYLDDAVRELKAALQLNPRTLHAHYLLGLVYLLQEEWAPKPKIGEQFLLELKLNPRDFLSTYLLGAMASNEKNFEASDKYLLAATEIQPDWSEPWLYLGLNANNQGNRGKAEEYLRKAIALNGPDDSRSNFFIRKAYFALGRILSQSDRKEEARTYLQKARELQEKVQADSVANGPAIGGLGDAHPTSIAATAFKTAEDRATLDRGGDSTAQLDAAALSRVNLSEDERKSALADEQRLRAILGASFNDLATSEAMRHQYALALDHYEEAARWQPDTPGLARNTGVTAIKAQKYSAAIKPLTQVLADDPRDNGARAMLGMAYYMTEQYMDAAQTISSLGEAALQDPGLGYAWADSLVKHQDLKKAGEILDKLEKLPLSTETLILVAHDWEEIGDHQRAIATYHRVLEVAPSQPKAHYYAGIAYIKSERPVDAAAEFQAELAISPSDADAKYNLGFAYLQQSKGDQAAALFAEVVTAHPEHANAQYQLGKILMDEGKIKEAISHLEAAVRLNPQTDYMHYQLQAAYRMDSRISDADRELALYKEIKASKRERQAQELETGRD